MSRTRRTTLTAITAAGTLAATATLMALSGQAANAIATGPIGTPLPLGAGTLTWKSTTTATTVTYSEATAGTQPQSLSGKSCKFSTSGSQYLTFAVTGPTVQGNNPADVGFKDLSLGVRSGNDSNGTSCKQVNPNTSPLETLTIAVNRAATSPLAAGFGAPSVKSASLDLNLSGNAIVLAALYKGDTLVGRAELQSGFSAPQAVSYEGSQLFTCNKDSNSGPQSGFNNNCYWDLSPLRTAEYTTSDAGIRGYTGPGGYLGPDLGSTPAEGATNWDTMVLTPKIGDFSIQGGNAWPTSFPANAGTIFNIESYSDGTINCYDPDAEDPAASLAAAQTFANGDSRAVITRLKLGDSSKTCEPKPYTYSDTGNTSVYHQQQTANQSSSQYAIVLPRDFTAAQVLANSTSTTPWPPLPKTIVNWEDGTNDVTLKYCVAGLITSQDTAENYYVPKPDYSKITSSLDQTANTPFTQYACIYRQTNMQNPDGSVTAFDYIYFLGDIRLGSG